MYAICQREFCIEKNSHSVSLEYRPKPMVGVVMNTRIRNSSITLNDLARSKNIVSLKKKTTESRLLLQNARDQTGLNKNTAQTKRRVQYHWLVNMQAERCRQLFQGQVQLCQVHGMESVPKPEIVFVTIIFLYIFLLNC